MTVTPRISEDGRWDRLGGSASKMNLLTPIGMGPTRRESSSWSCSELESVLEVDVVVGDGQMLTRSQNRHRSISTQGLALVRICFGE